MRNRQFARNGGFASNRQFARNRKLVLPRLEADLARNTRFARNRRYVRNLRFAGDTRFARNGRFARNTRHVRNLRFAGHTRFARNDLLKKTAEGRRVLSAFQSNTRRFEKLFDAFLEARNQPGVTLGPPPRPTTIRDRLEKLIPGPGARPLRTAQLNHILNKDINTELDIAGCDGERLQEYERTYINALSFPQLPGNSRESNNSQRPTSRASLTSHSPGARPMHRASAIADFLAPRKA